LNNMTKKEGDHFHLYVCDGYAWYHNLLHSIVIIIIIIMIIIIRVTTIVVMTKMIMIVRIMVRIIIQFNYLFLRVISTAA
jgi:hypothetical protein